MQLLDGVLPVPRRMTRDVHHFLVLHIVLILLLVLVVNVPLLALGHGLGFTVHLWFGSVRLLLDWRRLPHLDSRLVLVGRGVRVGPAVIRHGVLLGLLLHRDLRGVHVGVVDVLLVVRR